MKRCVCKAGECITCGGEGKTIAGECPGCNGSGDCKFCKGDS